MIHQLNFYFITPQSTTLFNHVNVNLYKRDTLRIKQKLTEKKKYHHKF